MIKCLCRARLENHRRIRTIAVRDEIVNVKRTLIYIGFNLSLLGYLLQYESIPLWTYYWNQAVDGIR